MRKRRLNILFGLRLLGLLAVMIPSLALAADGGVYEVAAGSLVSGNVATVSQDIRVDGEVTGDVTSWSGNITINGRVGGDVVSYTGRVTLAAQAEVRGSVMSLGGAVNRAPSAQISRATLLPSTGGVAVSSVITMFMPPSESSSSGSIQIGHAILGGLMGLLLAAFAFLWGALWPNRTLASAMALATHPIAALAVGLLATLSIAVILPPLASLLAASMIGMPLLVALAVLVHVPYVFGLATLGRGIALLSGGAATPTTVPSPAIVAVVVAVALLSAVACVWSPLAGLGVFYLLSSPGLGAVLLSRGGLLAPRLVA